jgi:hypothetical protein
MDSSLRDSLDSKSSAPARARKPAKGKGKVEGDIPPTEELLVVSVPTGSSNVKIQVSSTTVGGTQVPLFFLSANPTHKYKDGVALIFQSPQQTSTIYWYLDSTVSELTSESPALVFSAVQDQQQTVTTKAHTYKALAISFLVTFASGNQHDPQIIVTPIGGTKQAPRLSVKRPAKSKGRAAVAKKAPAKKRASATKKPARGKKR